MRRNFGYGAVGGVYVYSPGKRPFAHAISAQTFFTTRGVQNHFLRYDGPELFGNVRVEARQMPLAPPSDPGETEDACRPDRSGRFAARRDRRQVDAEDVSLCE